MPRAGRAEHNDRQQNLTLHGCSANPQFVFVVRNEPLHVLLRTSTTTDCTVARQPESQSLTTSGTDPTGRPDPECISYMYRVSHRMLYTHTLGRTFPFLSFFGRVELLYIQSLSRLMRMQC